MRCNNKILPGYWKCPIASVRDALSAAFVPEWLKILRNDSPRRGVRGRIAASNANPGATHSRRLYPFNAGRPSGPGGPAPMNQARNGIQGRATPAASCARVSIVYLHLGYLRHSQLAVPFASPSRRTNFTLQRGQLGVV